MSKIKASRIICAISALFILGVVGGIEKFFATTWTGVLWLINRFAVFALSALKEGYSNEIESYVPHGLTPCICL